MPCFCPERGSSQIADLIKAVESGGLPAACLLPKELSSVDFHFNSYSTIQCNIYVVNHSVAEVQLTSTPDIQFVIVSILTIFEIV